MREALFLKNNKHKWENIEKIIANAKTVSPDELSELFISLTDDLSYANTFYPNSNTCEYLNSLSYQAHSTLYQNKKEQGNRFLHFWKTELPLVVHTHRSKLILSLSFFIVSCLIGAVSAANDATFVRLILGDSYVNQTLTNIEGGDAMAIYKSAGQMDMFFGITFNNIRVSFMAFVFGFFLSFGTAYLLFSNGVMLGSFQYFFFQKGLLLPSVLSIWVHGTLEISAIVIAGGAGFVVGHSILFPKTYSRLQSFKKGAKDGLKIVIGLVPIFIIAGFLEGFVTRHASIDLAILSLGIIIFSFTFIAWYFIYYPIKIVKQQSNATIKQI